MKGYLKKIKFKEIRNSQETQAKQRKMETLTHYWTGFSQKQKLLLAFFGDGCLAKRDWRDLESLDHQVHVKLSQQLTFIPAGGIPQNITRGTLRQVPTRRIRLSLWNVLIQIFAICNIILEVCNGFRYRKGHSRLSLLLKNNNTAWSFVVFGGKLVQVSLIFYVNSKL